MDFHRKLFAGSLGQVGKRQLGLDSPQLLQKFDYRNGELVGAAGSGFLWDQTRQASLLEIGLGLIESGPRQTRLLSGLPDRGVLLDHGSQHFVFDLNKILRIEEGTVVKQRSGDGFRVRMQDVLFAEEVAFGLLGGLHM